MVCGLALAMLLAISTASAQSSSVIYEGNITDLNGVPYDGNLTFSVALYDASDSENPIWFDAFEDVPVNRGYFTLTLGSDETPLDPADFTGSVWLGITPGDQDELLPRKQMHRLTKRSWYDNLVLGRDLHCLHTIVLHRLARRNTIV